MTLSTYRYFSGESIQKGDFITTDNGFDTNIVLSLITDEATRDAYGLDSFGALLFSSSIRGMIFVSFDELSSKDTRLLKSQAVGKKKEIIDSSEQGNQSIL